jgi:hypothetical protein
MKIGIASSPSIVSAGAYPGCLVEIQEGAAQVEERCQDDVGERVRDPLAAFALRAKQRDQRQLRDADDDHDGGQ